MSLTKEQQKLVEHIDSLPVFDKYILNKPDRLNHLTRVNKDIPANEFGRYILSIELFDEIDEIPAFIHNGYVYTYDVFLITPPYGFKVKPECYIKAGLSIDFGEI